MKYYHYTTDLHLPKIQEAGFLKLVESNVSETEEHFGPDVVWLFKQPVKGKTPKMLQSTIDIGTAFILVDKSSVEIEVELPVKEVVRADKFYKKHKADSKWITQLCKNVDSSSKQWYVVERPVLVDEFVAVRKRPEAFSMIKVKATGKVERLYKNDLQALVGYKD